MLTETQRVMVAVENDAARTFVADNLQADGYEPLAVNCLGHASSRLSDRLDALIIDLGVDTIKLVDAVRADGSGSVDPQLPILALTAGHDRFHAIRLLDRGADDVICEPWLYVEIRARLAAVLRRASADRRRAVLKAGTLRVDVRSRRVWVGDIEIEMPAREFELLRVLVADPDRVFTRSELLQSVWGLGDWARTRTLDTHATRLRHRLNIAGESFVRNVWGVGYRLVDTGLTAV
ncbi:MAG TPA: response regulator transcription factor [Acidothermaceae bacterium]|nr:response regulator transcription factor [Acidothermaceae bacterium]